MSWSRFSEADVYTFPTHPDSCRCATYKGCGCPTVYECCACPLASQPFAPFRTEDVAEFHRHMDEHRAAGHDVPDDVYTGSTEWAEEHAESSR